MSYKKLKPYVSLIFLFGFLTSCPLIEEKDHVDGIKVLCNRLGSEINRSGKRSIIVAPFQEMEEESHKLDDFLAEEVSTYLMSIPYTTHYNIVDRSKLDLLIEEKGFETSGLLNQDTANELGKVVGADAIVVGKYKVLQSSVKLWLRVIDIEKAQIFAAAEEAIFKDDELKEALSESIGLEKNN